MECNARVISGSFFKIYQLNTLRPRQNGRHFADAIFKCNLLNENVWIPIKSSLKFVPKGPINYIPALVQIMAWQHNRRQAIIWTNDDPVQQRIYASLGLNELSLNFTHGQVRFGNKESTMSHKPWYIVSHCFMIIIIPQFHSYYVSYNVYIL